MIGQIFAQTYNLSKLIKKFGNKILNAALAEVKQIHDRTCFRKIDVKNLTSQESKQAMESLIFPRKNSDGRIKGRHLINGSIQRDNFNS